MIFEIYRMIEVIFRIALPMLLAVAAVVGLVMVLTTRADAFDAADRKSKGVWAGMLAGSAAFLAFPMIGWMMLGIPIIASLVITGIYWLDVRPQIRGILDNAQGGW
ncbi:DUF2516 family protein [Corynebacterium hansenii]|uniref:DUF2516 family protein n=1 Tax=Corynebacterium hansenii TaxID=394964 RepID=A0ABV7ZL73_9CORY|nr:DUF2516 family protein [Corynebacterium hansenii]WJY98906.1 hypothetical protein CHAN_01355 [Corynebacterium hansenii]